ncbi:MAG TPA: hypothetical protein VK465_12890, partial [Fibrobacteria bacterium]|nr:hypothetical protein [Fibrobacteria bacterium]
MDFLAWTTESGAAQGHYDRKSPENQWRFHPNGGHFSVEYGNLGAGLGNGGFRGSYLIPGFHRAIWKPESIAVPLRREMTPPF